MQTYLIFNHKTKPIQIPLDSLVFVLFVSNSNWHLIEFLDVLLYIMLLSQVPHLLEQHLFVIHKQKLLSQLGDHLVPTSYLLSTILNTRALQKLLPNGRQRVPSTLYWRN